MTLTGLRYFISLAELRNFSQVAKKFYVAQAAVSYQISSMEKELGVRLFERSTRSVKLTPVGRSFYIKVKPLVEQLDEACSQIKNRPKRETFTFGYSRVCFGHKFRMLLNILSQRHPEVDIILEVDEPEYDLFERLHAGQIDAALFFNPVPTLPDYLDYIPFGRSRVMIVAESHPLADHPYILEEDIPKREVIASEGMRRIEQMGLVSGDGIQDNREIVLRELESVLAMVQAGKGIACLPIIDDVSITGLRYIPIIDYQHPDKGPELIIAWNKGSDSPILRSSREIAEQLLTGFADKYI